MTRRVLWLIIGGLIVVFGCPTPKPEPRTTVYSIDDGPLAGAQLEIPESACSNPESFSLTEGESISLAELSQPDRAIESVGPALEVGPDGTVCSGSVTVSLPFSTKAYNAGDVEGAALWVVGRHAGGSIIQIDVGPVFLESVEPSNTPIEIDVGPVFLVANEGNEENDALLVFNVSSFSSYQVVRTTKGDQVCDQWEQVSAGSNHSCGLLEQNSKTELFCWGDNDRGALGNNHKEKGPRYGPKVALEDDDNKDWRTVSAGGSHTCAIDSEKDLYCWGSDSHGQLGTGTVTTWNWIHPTPVSHVDGWESVSLGARHTCAIDTDEQLWCWGDNSVGQLGNGYVGQPSQTGNPKKLIAGVTDIEWAHVVAGLNHTCALSKDDALYCWGQNANGQVDPLESKAALGTPTRIQTPTAQRFEDVALGGKHTCAVTGNDCDDEDNCEPDGTLFCWGNNDEGQLGTQAEEGNWPMAVVVADHRWGSVAAGNQHTCAIADSEEKGLWCWGNNNHGQLMAETDSVAKSGVPVPVASDYRWRSLSLGQHHTCGLVEDGDGRRLLCGGSNLNAQLGERQDVPAEAQAPTAVCVPREDPDPLGQETSLDKPNPNCTPDCTGLVCGDDGCGGTCGACPDVSYQCVDGLCELACTDDDDNNSPLTAIPVPIAESFVGGFCPVSEEDWYAFTLESPGTFSIFVGAPDVDPEILINVYDDAVLTALPEDVIPLPIGIITETDTNLPTIVYTGSGDAGVHYVRLRLKDTTASLPDDWFYKITVEE